MAKVLGEMVLLTPDLATKWLEGQVHNRPIRDGWVRELARRIKAGQWQITGDTIKFTPDGEMLDGQHRCWAIIEAGIPVNTLVARNVDPSAFTVLDSGQKRTLADVLSISGKTDGQVLGAMLNLVISYDNHRSLFSTKASSSEALKYIETHPAMLASCEIGKKVKLLTPPRAGFLHYIFSRVDKDRADVFLDRLITGESLSESSPILLYRNKMISQQAHKRDRMGELAFGIISFNHFQSGKYPKDLRWADRSKFPRVLGEKIS